MNKIISVIFMLFVSANCMAGSEYENNLNEFIDVFFKPPFYTSNHDSDVKEPVLTRFGKPDSIVTFIESGREPGVFYQIEEWVYDGLVFKFQATLDGHHSNTFWITGIQVTASEHDLAFELNVGTPKGKYIEYLGPTNPSVKMYDHFLRYYWERFEYYGAGAPTRFAGSITISIDEKDNSSKIVWHCCGH